MILMITAGPKTGFLQSLPVDEAGSLNWWTRVMMMGLILEAGRAQLK